MADMGGKYDPSGLKKPRKSNFSPEEIEALVTTVNKNYHILYGVLAKRAVNKQARHKVWLEVMRQVNRVSVEKRTLQEVKNKWKKCQHTYRESESVDDIVLPNVWEPLSTFQDSMPLEQRLKVPSEQEPVLQSQPLSPTKLKVTRQSSKPSQPSPKPVTPEPPNEEVCLRWNSHHSNMQTSFPSLLLKEQYVDATLVAEGRSLKCHRLILSSCSPYFEEVLNGISPFQHPVLFMKDIPFWVLKSLCDFMYAGEVHIFQNKLEELLAVAESLKIKGLAHKMDGSNDEVKTPEQPSKPVKEEKKELKKEEKEVKEKKRNFQHFESTPKSNSKGVKSAHPAKKVEKASKESLSKQAKAILDPLDLLEPVYEEVTKESMPPKLKEIKNIPVKKGKIKKRKISDPRDESPPPMFISRKGTRSRPNVKIPKYFHTHYERVSDATIVREPHTEPDPLLEVEEIKAEPLDLDDDVIEIEDNVIDFSAISHDEEIIGNYDSPLVNLNDKIHKGESQDSFKKLGLVPQPIIMDVHSIAEKSPNSVQIVDLGQLKSQKTDDPLDTMLDIECDKVGEDPLNFDTATEEKGTQGITITNVQSIADLEDEEKSVDATIEDEHLKKGAEIIEQDGECCNFRIEKVVSEVEDTENIVVVDDLPEIQEKSGEKEKIIETPVICIDVTETENTEANTSATDDVICLDPPLANSVEKDSDLGPGNSSQALNVSNNENEAIISHPVLEGNVIINDIEMETTEMEEIVPEPGFHIAKVASEQFLVHENVDSAVISEDCAAELGFQITNVVSEHIEDADMTVTEGHIKDAGMTVVEEAHIEDADMIVTEKGHIKDVDMTVIEEGHIEEVDMKVTEEANTSDLGTFSNHLSEGEGEMIETRGDTVEGEITRRVESETLNEDTQFLAESLERLLDE